MTPKIIELTKTLETLSKSHGVGFMDVLNEIMICHVHRVQNED